MQLIARHVEWDRKVEMALPFRLWFVGLYYILYQNGIFGTATAGVGNNVGLPPVLRLERKKKQTGEKGWKQKNDK
jgi:hypothetical protein